MEEKARSGWRRWEVGGGLGSCLCLRLPVPVPPGLPGHARLPSLPAKDSLPRPATHAAVQGLPHSTPLQATVTPLSRYYFIIDK